MKKITYLFFSAAVFLLSGLTADASCRVKSFFTYRADSCKIIFNDSSLVAPGATITAWNWNFGDGNTSTAQNPVHTYTASGSYMACLSVVATDTNGITCKDRFCVPVLVRHCGNTPPPPPSLCGVRPFFTYKTDSCKVIFTDSSKTALGTSITSWNWNFGDGNTSTSPNPVHTYTASGSYAVCLVVTATNANGVACKERFCIPVLVRHCGNTPPPPAPCGVRPFFTYKTDSCKVMFTDSSKTAPGTSITSWNWNFGDGNTSTSPNPVHTYTASGSYAVCLVVTATNANGVACKERFCIPVQVRHCGTVPPRFQCGVRPFFTYKADSCKVSFGDSSRLAPGVSITAWHWDFGDGSTSAAQHPVHVYNNSGIYKVCLTVSAKDLNGQVCKKRIFCQPVRVNCGPLHPPVNCGLRPYFAYKTDTCKTVVFGDSSKTAPGTTITGWHWNFGDGSTSSTQHPAHIYGKSGLYRVCLTVSATNANGVACKETFCSMVAVRSCRQQAEPETAMGLNTEGILFQLYPNPANQTVNISFELSKAGQTGIVVYDMQGRAVEVIQDEILQEGSHTLTWKISDDIPAGIYFITVKTGTYIEQNKLVIVK